MSVSACILISCFFASMRSRMESFRFTTSPLASSYLPAMTSTAEMDNPNCSFTRESAHSSLPCCCVVRSVTPA